MHTRRFVLVLILAALALVAGLVAWIGGSDAAGVEREPPAASLAVTVSNASGTAETVESVDEDARERTEASARRAVPRRSEPVEVSVRGTIVDERGAPIEGATVELSTRYGTAPGDDVSSEWERNDASGKRSSMRDALRWAGPGRKSDGSGNFTVDGLAGNVVLRAQALGFEPTTIEVGALAAGAKRDGVTIALMPTPRTRVRVTWPDGSPVAGAFITYFPDVPSWDTSAGRLHPEGQKSHLAARIVSRFVIMSVSDDAGLSELETSDLALRDPEWTAWRLHAERPRPVRAGVDAAFEEPLAAFVREHASVWSASVAGTGPVPGEVALVLAPGCALAGRVVDARGTPIAGARVSATALASANDDRPPADTDARGFYFLDVWRVGRIALFVRPPDGFEPRRFELDLDASLVRRDFVLARRPTIAGVIRDPFGNPRPRARITIVGHGAEPPAARVGQKLDTRERESGLGIALSGGHNLNAIADDEGRFKIERVPLGWAQIVASGEGAFASAPLEVLVEGDEDQLELALRLRRGAAVVVEARAKDGAPLARRRLHALPEGDEKPAHQLVTDADGAARLKSLAPGRWTFRLLDRAPDESEPAPSAAPAAEPMETTVELPEGRTTIVTFGS